MRELMTYVLGVHMTRFSRVPERSHKELAAEAVRGAVADSQLTADRIEAAWFANCDLHQWGQPNIRGHVCLAPLFESRELLAHTPVSNVEAGCASGFLAFRGACLEVMSGEADVALAVGVDKPYQPDAPDKMRELYDGIFDQLDFDAWRTYYENEARKISATFAPNPHRIMLLDVCDLHTQAHMRAHGTTAENIAFVTAKNRHNGTLNPNALLQKEKTAQQILEDPTVIGSLTRSMCAPVADGAAAAIVISESMFRSLSAGARERAIKVESLVFRSGQLRDIDAPSVTHSAADLLYKRTATIPSDIDFAEVHDATSLEELCTIEALGFAEPGQAAAASLAGQTARDGRQPINASGGLVSKGHPPAASGLAMVFDVTRQLRGEAGKAQLPKARRGLLHNAGGLMGLDEAACGLALLSNL